MQCPSLHHDVVEERWVNFFRDPSSWWDNRSRRNCIESPSFKHVISGETLYISSCPESLREKLEAVEIPRLSNKGTKARYKPTTTGNGERRTISQLVNILKECGEKRDLETGKKVHAAAIASGFHTNKYIATGLINMYSKGRSMGLAQKVFDEILQKDVVIWTSLILGYVENEKCFEAIEIFTRMDCEPSSYTYVAVLKACGGFSGDKSLCLEKGLAIHNEVVACGLDSNLPVANAVLEMYCKCGSTQLAREFFDKMSSRDVVSWTNLILGYVEKGESSKALELFTGMDIEPDSVTYIAVLKACSSLAIEQRKEKQSCLEKGIEIHKRIDEHGFNSDVMLMNSIVDMYCKCGNIQLAREVFDKMNHRSTVTWNTLLKGCVDNGESLEAMNFFEEMNCEPDSLTYATILRGCSSLGSERDEEKEVWLEKANSIYKRAELLGLDPEKDLLGNLLQLYCKCGSMDQAKELFDKIPQRNASNWTNLILGYVNAGEHLLAANLFTSMDVEPDSVTYVAVLKAFIGLASGVSDPEKRFWLEKGLELHERAKAFGFDTNNVVGTSLLQMYSRCGSMKHAKQVFDKLPNPDIIAWTCLIVGYVENGEYSLAVELFSAMSSLESPDSLTYVAALRGLAGLATNSEKQRRACLIKGTAIHQQVKARGFASDAAVQTSLISMYSKCGNLENARAVFDEMEHRDVVAWTCLISGYVEHRESSAARELFARMDCRPDSKTLVAALKASGNLAALKAGQEIHAQVCKLGYERDAAVASALMEFYKKCGRFERAEAFFACMQ